MFPRYLACSVGHGHELVCVFGLLLFYCWRLGCLFGTAWICVFFLLVCLAFLVWIFGVPCWHHLGYFRECSVFSVWDPSSHCDKLECFVNWLCIDDHEVLELAAIQASFVDHIPSLWFVVSHFSFGDGPPTETHDFAQSRVKLRAVGMSYPQIEFQ